MMKMEPDEGRRPRRRPRDIAFFDHGEPVSTERKMLETERKSRAFGSRMWTKGRLCFRIFRILVQLLAIWIAILTLGGLVLRGTGYFCQHTPMAPGFCKNPWAKRQESLLSQYAPGRTPTTNALQTLAKLNEMSPSLEALGLVMSLANANLSTTSAEVIGAVVEDKLENLFAATQYAQEEVEGFVDEDYFYRSSSLLWNPNSINELGIRVELYLEALNETSPWQVAVVEHGLHRLPYMSGWTLSRNVLDGYLRFVEEQEQVVKEMVIHATETGMLLGDLIGIVGRFERALELMVEEGDGSPNQLRTVALTRPALRWAQHVVEEAEKHYKMVLSELTRALKILQADMMGYQSLWPAKSAVPLGRVNGILNTEQAQIDAYVRTVIEADESSEQLSNNEDEDEEELVMSPRLMEAIARKELIKS